ncbi:MAG: PKD domain-containing protein [Labilibaculum antarcticum]
MAKNTVEPRQFRIDSMISNFFIFVMIPLVALLGFKFYTQQAPPEVSFHVLGDEHMENEMLKFRNNTAGDHSYEWNFGDSTEFSQDNSPIHIYSEAGDYTVTLLVDGQYKFPKLIKVERLKDEKPMIIIPRIAGPKQMFVGASAIFTCSTKGGNSWEWRVNGSRKVYSKNKSVKYTFSKPGYKTISLVVDGNREFTVKKKIYVRIKPSEKQKFVATNSSTVKKEEDYIPETPEVYTVLNNIKKESVKEKPFPTDKELTVMLLKIAKGSGDKEKFLKCFNENNKNLMVRCNGDLITFENLIKDVEGSNIVIKEFSTERRNSTQIVNVIIRYKKKRGFKNDLL